MGLLTQGQPLEWDEFKNDVRIVQDIGIRQFINLYNGSKNRADGPFKWGDEVMHQLRATYMRQTMKNYPSLTNFQPF